jgi:hypothetical protein
MQVLVEAVFNRQKGVRTDYTAGSFGVTPSRQLANWLARSRFAPQNEGGTGAAVQSPAAYVDRQGTLHLPFDDAFELARRFCGAGPGAVSVGAEATERKWMRKARHGEDYIIGLLNEYRAAWALVRQWAGHDAAMIQREAEIQRLERLV